MSDAPARIWANENDVTVCSDGEWWADYRDADELPPNVTEYVRADIARGFCHEGIKIGRDEALREALDRLQGHFIEKDIVDEIEEILEALIKEDTPDE